MVLIDENKAKGHAPPFFQKILCSNAFHTFILCLVLASGITGANLAFGHKTKFNDGKPDGFYFAEAQLAEVVMNLLQFLYSRGHSHYTCLKLHFELNSIVVQ
jgi:hypothetical protein